MIFRECDVKYENFSGSGPGGQYRNRHANCVRAIHIPTGVSAQSTSERSAGQNKVLALANLRAKFIRLVEDRDAREAKQNWDDKPDAAYGTTVVRSYRLCGKDQGVVDSRVDETWPIQVLTKGEMESLILAILRERMREQVQRDASAVSGTQSGTP
jgi:protein subunit release factor A